MDFCSYCLECFTLLFHLMNSYSLFYLFTYFWLRWVFIAARALSLVAAGGGLLFVAVRRFIVVASLVAEHRL